MFTLAAAAAAAVAAIIIADDPAKDAADALELHYLNAGPYEVPRCDAERGETFVWVRCYPVRGRDEVVGGLFAISADPNDESRPLIWAANGRALQHLGDLEAVLSVDGEEIPAGRWNGDGVIDTAEAFNLFEIEQ